MASHNHRSCLDGVSSYSSTILGLSIALVMIICCPICLVESRIRLKQLVVFMMFLIFMVTEYCAHLTLHCIIRFVYLACIHLFVLPLAYAILAGVCWEPRYRFVTQFFRVLRAARLRLCVPVLGHWSPVINSEPVRSTRGRCEVIRTQSCMHFILQT